MGVVEAIVVWTDRLAMTGVSRAPMSNPSGMIMASDRHARPKRLRRLWWVTAVIGPTR